MTPAKYETVKGMAAILNVSTDTMRRLAKSKKVPSIKVGALLRFEPERVISSLEKKQSI